eukprot:m.1581515 g.1581515  ORF g.1581515 m.1581515 type:complete len:67 (+) comp25317_c0_seq10:3093-3293(+)
MYRFRRRVSSGWLWVGAVVVLLSLHRAVLTGVVLHNDLGQPPARTRMVSACYTSSTPPHCDCTTKP